MLYGKVGMAGVVAALLTLGSVTPSSAQDTVRMKFGHPFSNDHWAWKQGGGYFANLLTEATGGKVQFDIFPGSQTGTDSPAALKSGVLNFALVVPGYTPEKLQLSQVVELPVHHENACAATRKFWEVSKEGAVLDKAEFAPNGMRAIFVFANPPYKIFTSKKEIKSLNDLRGLKIRAAGAPMQKTAAALGAVPVQLSGPELFDSVSRGTIDGVFLGYSSVTPFSLEKSFKYVVEGPAFGQGSTIFAISKQTWDGLSDDMKAKVHEAAMKTQDHICAYLDGLEAEVRQMMIREHGLKVNTIPPDQIAQWAQKTNPVVEAWSKDMDSVKRRGSEAAQAFIQAK
jgi:TRAP-type C4-dicarboxylate transport system substrate-binding protein